MHESIDFGNLARAILARGYTTRQLGDAVGLSQPSVSRLATGKTGEVSAQVGLRLIKLAGGRVELPELAVQAQPEAQRVA
jgi:transcriptional regulator with XRE-family HTH domain